MNTAPKNLSGTRRTRRVITLKQKPLDEQEWLALEAVERGADVYSDVLASYCRGLRTLGLVRITKAMMPEVKDKPRACGIGYYDGVWFGCIATAKGVAMLKQRRSDRRDA